VVKAMLAPSDLSACDLEPIHTPGSTQPHGMMLVADRDGFRVRHVAGDVEGRLAVSAWAGEPLALLVGDMLAARIATLNEGGAPGFMGQLRAAGGETLDVTANVSAGYVIVELEAAATDIRPASVVIDSLATAAAIFERAASLTALCDRAAGEFRRLTGFDRVMIYRFLPDGAGKVLAEDRRADLHSFLNHHFPAADIPVQARALYLRNVVRVIPDAFYQPVALRPEWGSVVPLDMSDAALRSVSPIHLVYLANMGVMASASFSIVRDGVLWGLVACHHDTPKILTYDVRAACKSLVGSLGRWIKAKDEAEGYRERLRLRGFEDDIVALLSREGSLDDALSNHLNEVGRMMDSDGVAVRRGRDLIVHGLCPTQSEIRDLAAWVLQRTLQPVFSTSALSGIFPPAAEYRKSASGVLAVTLSVEEPWVLFWFRAEQIEDVKWAGNPHQASDDPQLQLTPRASFAAWSETVRGRARDWTQAAIGAATRLRLTLLEVQQSRRIRDLNRQLTVILHDKDRLLQQKEFLINEVNHRVQNSLQIVSSFLSVQARASTNPDLQTALSEARRRLTAVALVHRRLYRGGQVEVVDAARYIDELCTDTFLLMGEDWSRHLSLVLAPIQIPTDQAIPLGLVLTELLINAHKHAYGAAPGPIEVQLIEDQTHVHMIVSDKGRGIAVQREGFGSRIMAALVHQLGGVIAFSDNAPGLRAAVSVPFRVAKLPG
jgi:chemotaxis family two-component system sensor kinase Cph1